jgi:2-hydroxychromene-2-carboxylate isomerase
MPLETGARLAQPDEFYQALIDAHAGLDDDASAALNARLVLLLANQIGDLETLREALAVARGVSGRPSA